MDRQFWRETRRSALVLLLLFFTSGTMLVVGKAGSNEYGTDPLSISVLIANRAGRKPHITSSMMRRPIARTILSCCRNMCGSLRRKGHF